ncbi:MAG: histidine kinase, partial [uncultured bacterium]
YSEKGSVVVNVTAEGKMVRIMVTDSGGGISAEELPHLFEKFMRGEKQKRIYVDGVGIGLYIGKVVIEGHGGRIWAKSKEGEGSTFFVELPVTD